MSGVSDDRGVSTVVGFVLTLGITSLLVIGLLVGTSGFVDGQRQGTIRDEMEVLGQQLAADIAAADRLVRAGGDTVSIDRPFPNDVTGLSYLITIDGGQPVTITLTTSDPDVSVEVTVRTVTDVAGGTTLNGGPVEVDYDESSDELVVQND
jgi:hypothetical protein